jgi:plastocyanin
MVLAGSLLGAAAAYADETITARPKDEFASARTTIDQGEKVTLRNVDISGHDVVSTKKSEDSKPLFQSELVEPQSSGPVEGTEYLTTGTYPFICTIHPGMDATLEVTSAGTPKPRPDPPKVTIKITSGDIQKVAESGKLKLRVTTTKAEIKLTAKRGKKKLGSKTVDFDSAGKKAVTLKLTKAGRNALEGRNSAKVSVTGVATDAAGQTTKSSATRTLD